MLIRRLDLSGETPEQVGVALNMTANNLRVRHHRAANNSASGWNKPVGSARLRLSRLHLRGLKHARKESHESSPIEFDWVNYFFSIPAVAPAPFFITQQNASSLPHILQVWTILSVFILP